MVCTGHHTFNVQCFEDSSVKLSVIKKDVKLHQFLHQSVSLT